LEEDIMHDCHRTRKTCKNVDFFEKVQENMKKSGGNVEKASNQGKVRE